MHNKKICILRHHYYSRDPRLQREVEVLIKAGFSVDIICLKESNLSDRDIDDDVTLYTIPVSHRRSNAFRYVFEYSLAFIYFFLITSYLGITRRYSHVQVNTPPDILVFAATIPKILGARIVMDMYEVMPELYASKFNVSCEHVLIKVIKWFERISTRYADVIITVNEPIKKLLIERSAIPVGSPVVLNAPNEGEFSIENINEVNMTKSGSEFIILSHGTFAKRYGFDTLISAIPLMISTIPNLKIMIFGDGEEKDSLISLASGLGVNAYLSLPGYVSQDSLSREIQKADICVIPLLGDDFTELMLPNKLFEYAMLKKPIVCSSLSTIREYFNEDCILYVEPADEQELAAAIISLYLEPNIREIIAECALETYQQYSWVFQKLHYLEVMDE